MRCNICDKALSEAEVVWNKELDTYEPCAFCLEVAMDAAYSDGFQKPDDVDAVSILDNDAEDFSLFAPAAPADITGRPAWASFIDEY